MAAAHDTKCKCGRRRADAIFTSFDTWGQTLDGVRRMRHFYYRCECGAEWTEDRVVVDPGETITADEVIDVHERLRSFEGSLTELLTEKC